MKIRLHPVGLEIEGDSNRSLLQLCHDNKVELKSLCKGVPSCAECRIKILAGDANVIPPNKAELSLIGTSYYIDGRRLACQIRCFGDISVDITDHLKEDDNTTKKLRGYRAPPGQSRESKAVQGTMVLQEPSLPAEPAGGGRRGRGGGAGNENRAAANDRGRQVKHPGDELVAGSEHPEPLDSADLDGSGDEGVIDALHAGGDIYAGDEADTSEAITQRLGRQIEADDEDDEDYDDEGEDGGDAEAPARQGGQNRGGSSANRGGARGGGGGGGQHRGGGPQQARGPGGGGPGASGEGGGQKRRRRRGGRGRRGGSGGSGGGGGGNRGPGGGAPKS